MKTRRTISLFLMILARFCSATEPPRPWMADRTQVYVIHLVCEPPPEGSHWKEVTDLQIFWLRQGSNTTLANMNNHLERLGDPPNLSADLPPLSSASFSGSFGNKDPSLSVFLPMTSSNNAEIFYCNIHKTDSDANQGSKMSSKIVTNGQLTMTTIPKGFRWEKINGHKLHVTWYQERPSKFTYASIQRISINKEKKQSLARQPLLITDGKQNISFPKEDLLAVSLTMGKPNYTLTVILREKDCEFNCIYTCHVPHRFCSGQDEKDCLCPVPASVTLQTPCNSSVSEEKSTTPSTAYVSEENSEACTIACSIVCPLLLAIGIVLGVVITWYMSRRKETKTRTGDKKQPTGSVRFSKKDPAHAQLLPKGKGSGDIDARDQNLKSSDKGQKNSHHLRQSTAHAASTSVMEETESDKNVGDAGSDSKNTEDSKGSNATLAIMNNHLERSSDPPNLSADLPPLSSASFSGSFGNKDPSLSVFLPMTSSNNAEIFYCNIHKTDSDANQASKMSSQIVTNGQPTMTTEPKGFRWENILGYKLHVTWYQKRPSKFTYASIQRISINKDKKQSLARQPLLITDGKQNISFPKEDLLAVSLTMGKPNFTLTVILREKHCEFDCIYTCHVPHPFCSGQDEKDCLCPVPASVTLQTPCNSSVSEEKSTTPSTAYVSEENSEACTIAYSIVCPLLLAIGIVLGVVIMYMSRRKEPKTRKGDQKNTTESGISKTDPAQAQLLPKGKGITIDAARDQNLKSGDKEQKNSHHLRQSTAHAASPSVMEETESDKNVGDAAALIEVPPIQPDDDNKKNNHQLTNLPPEPGRGTSVKQETENDKDLGVMYRPNASSQQPDDTPSTNEKG